MGVTVSECLLSVFPKKIMHISELEKTLLHELLDQIAHVIHYRTLLVRELFDQLAQITRGLGHQEAKFLDKISLR